MHNWRQLTGNILLELKGAGSDSLCSYCLQIPTAVILVCEQQPLTYLLCQLWVKPKHTPLSFQDSGAVFAELEEERASQHGERIPHRMRLHEDKYHVCSFNGLSAQKNPGCPALTRCSDHSLASQGRSEMNTFHSTSGPIFSGVRMGVISRYSWITFHLLLAVWPGTGHPHLGDLKLSSLKWEWHVCLCLSHWHSCSIQCFSGC